MSKNKLKIKIAIIFGAIVFNSSIVASSLWSFIWSLGVEGETHLISNERPWRGGGQGSEVAKSILNTIKVPKKESKESEVAQSRPTLCDPMDCSPPGYT